MLIASLVAATSAAAPLPQGELQARTPASWLRICETGPDHGLPCNDDADCSGGSVCTDRNRLDLVVAVDFVATPTQLAHVESFVVETSEAFFDATDGQFQIRFAEIVNNAAPTLTADVRILPAFCTQGTNLGQPCHGPSDCTDPPNVTWGSCGYIPTAAPGGWQLPNGDFTVTMDKLDGLQTDPYWASADRGHFGAHELAHLVFEVRDEYKNGLECPVVELAGEPRCLMSHPDGFPGDYELCWGETTPGDPPITTAGNHDPSPGNAQHAYHGHSCWDQVAWAFPDVATAPASGPDPQSNGSVHEPVLIFHTDGSPQVMLVLDTSGSMALEAPSRLERLQAAAHNVILAAEGETSLGIVSFSTDADPSLHPYKGLGVPPLGGSSAWGNVVDTLIPAGATHIGDGLARAKKLLDTSSATGPRSVVLMTDGLNNQPPPQTKADADLAATLQDLEQAGIVVNVTCTGADVGLGSQCASIAAATGGTYQTADAPADQAMSTGLQEAFFDLFQHATGQAPVSTSAADLGEDLAHELWIDEGSDVATFLVMWSGEEAPEVRVTSPDGREHDTRPLVGGAMVRVDEPQTGTWQVQVDATDPDEHAMARAYVSNRAQTLRGAVRHRIVELGEPLHVLVTPRGAHAALTHDTPLLAEVIRPDGVVHTIEIDDLGSDGAGTDAIAKDGVFAGVYGETDVAGTYTFVVSHRFEEWTTAPGEHDQAEAVAPLFEREVRITGVVVDPTAKPGHPEDGRQLKRHADGEAPAEDTVLGCGCATGAAGGASTTLALLLGLAWRRRRR
ncbi:MAG: VWA domain-containing protein [Myxococcales bacterium]|nr:VWA domain-containing protein [Myxococcales bacterium]